MEIWRGEFIRSDEGHACAVCYLDLCELTAFPEREAVLLSVDSVALQRIRKDVSLLSDRLTRRSSRSIAQRMVQAQWIKLRGSGTVSRTLDIESLMNDEEHQHYHTLGGFAMAALRRLARTGDKFERSGYRFEIIDMDGISSANAR
jgi:hypothetical protein